MDEQLYKHAMENGYVELILRLLILMGVTGSGKSLFQKLVLDQPAPNFSHSTSLAESAVRTMSICPIAVGGGDQSVPGGLVKWKKLAPQEMMDMVAKAIDEKALKYHTPTNQPANVRLQTNLESPKTEPDHGPLQTFKEKNYESNLQGTPHEETPHSSTILTQSEKDNKQAKKDATRVSRALFTEALNKVQVQINSKLTKKLSNQSAVVLRKLMDVNFVYLLDSGGQPPFREMLPHFVQQASAVVLLLKLNEELGFKPTIKYREEEENVGNGYTSQLTNEQILYQYIQAVQSHKSKVFVVGSHLDKKDECQESIEMKNERLLGTFRPVIGRNIVMHRMGKPDQLIFPVDSTSRNPEDMVTVEEFKKRVMDPDVCEGKKENIPLSWFVLEQVLQSLCDEMGMRVLGIAECFEAAEKMFSMPNSTCEAAIKYLDKLNIMFYRHQVLRGVVFANAQVILDKITELVRCNHALRTGEEQKVPSCMMQGEEGFPFRDSGLIDEKLLGKAFPSHYRDDVFTPTHLLTLLESLLIASKLENGKHFMPSLLPDLPEENIAEYRVTTHPAPEGCMQERPAPIVIHYPKMWVPVGVMASLVVYLQNIYNWKLFESGGKPTCVYHNCIKFTLPEGEPGYIVLIDSIKVLEIHVHSNPKVPPDVLVIKKHIVTSLKAVHKSLHYDSAEAKLGFLCSGTCGYKEPHCALFHGKKDIWTCSKDESVGDNLDMGQKVWHLQEIIKGQLYYLKGLS